MVSDDSATALGGAEREADSMMDIVFDGSIGAVSGAAGVAGMTIVLPVAGRSATSRWNRWRCSAR